MRVGTDAVREAPVDDERRETGVAPSTPARQLRSLLSSWGPAIAIVAVQLVAFPMPAGIFVRGLVVGALMALLALGMALVYRANRIVNFAQSYMGYAPALLAFLLMDRSGVPYGVALAAGLASALALGAVTERVVIRRFFRAPRLLVTIATIGLGQLLAGAALLLPSLWDTQVFSGRIPVPFDLDFQIGDVVFDANDLIGLVVAPLTVLAVAVFLQRSATGMAIRASADSADRAALLGIPVHRLQTLVWMVASVLAFVTVFLRGGILGVPTAGTQASLSLLFLPLLALVLGRLTDLVGVTSAAVALGVLSLGIEWNHSEQLVDPLLGVVLVMALVLRRREVGRRDATEDTAWRATEEVRPVPPALSRRPEARAGRWGVLGLVGVVALVLPQALDVGQTVKASALLIYAILGVSLVVLSGWGGIISFGHVAYFALGAAVAGWAISELGLDLLPAMLLAMVAGAAAATVVGLPAIRLRGLYLAVSSFAFALAAMGYLLNDEYFGWVPTDRVERAPLLGGFELNSEDQTYYLALAMLVLVILGVRNIRASRFGRALVALRDNDRAAQAYSVDAVRVQLTAFALSGALAALAGALLLHHERNFDTSLFRPVENLAVFTMVVVGGMTSATGAVLGALFLLGTRWFLPTDWQVLAAGCGVIAALVLFPRGLASVVFAGRDRLLRLLAAARGLDVPGYSRAPDGLDPLAVTAADSSSADSRTAVGTDASYGLLRDGGAAESATSSTEAAGGGPNAGADEQEGAVEVAGGGLASGRSPVDATGDELLSVRGVEVGYGGVKVLFGVDLDVRAGEAVALLGTNGAGKSTLLRAISGLVEPEAGTIDLAGDDITGDQAHRVAARGVQQMPGGHGVFPTLTVAENLRVASWLHRRDPAAVEAGIARVHELFPVLAERAGQRASHLSGGQQQMLALGMAVLGRPKLLMIDELSLGLAPSVVGELLRFVNRLRDDGTTLLVVEQSVNVALEIADRAVFLERGQVRFSGPARDLLDRPDLLRSVFLGSASPSPAGATSSAAPGEPAKPAGPVLQVVDLAVHFDGVRAVDGVSFEVAPGEILGVIGPNGAGKTTLFDLLSGFVPPSAGHVLLNGSDVTRLRPSARSRLGLGRSFQDARLFSSLTVDEAIAAARERWVQAGDPLSAAFALPNVYDSEWAIARRVDELVEVLGLGPYRSLFVGELSTGTRRVVDLACLLAHRPRVVLLDEPAAGIAQREVEALAPLIGRIRDELKASVLLVEHDMPLVESVADRLVAMDRGRVLATGSATEVLTDPEVVRSYLGDEAAAVQRSGDQSAVTGRRQTTESSR